MLAHSSSYNSGHTKFNVTLINVMSVYSDLTNNSNLNCCTYSTQHRCKQISCHFLTCNFVSTDWQLPSAMSRFFATGSDSESEESSSADEITPKAPGATFKQSVQLIVNLLTLSPGLILCFVVISHTHVAFTGRCFSVMMRRTLREWCAAPKIKG